MQLGVLSAIAFAQWLLHGDELSVKIVTQEIKPLAIHPPPRRKQLRISTDTPTLKYTSHFSSGSSSALQTPPTPATSVHSPGCLFHALCMHNFESSDPVHLPFRKNEVLIIVKREHSGWWAAMRPEGDRMGWIPSSFVLPLDRNKAAEHSDETPWSCEALIDSPLSAVHDLWVPVSDEDSKVLTFQLVTPTDIVSFKDVPDVRIGNYSDGAHFNLSSHDRYRDVGEICIPLTPESPSPLRIRGPCFPPSPLSSEPGTSQLTRLVLPPSFDAEWYSRPYTLNDQTSRLSASVNPDDDTPARILTSGVERFTAVSNSVSRMTNSDTDTQPDRSVSQFDTSSVCYQPSK